jgi:hypothetical protein
VKASSMSIQNNKINAMGLPFFTKEKKNDIINCIWGQKWHNSVRASARSVQNVKINAMGLSFSQKRKI